MKYFILLAIALIAGLGWYYYECVYPVPDEHETLAFGIECDAERFSYADECKRACAVVFVFCAFLAAVLGASE